MKKTATNQFGDGLVTDFHPLTAKNTTLVDALNATLVTTKGNEMILQNDAGNIRIKIKKENNEIEYAQLSEGFIPVGIKEYNGIIYIASYNNDTGYGELGSYPSPEYLVDSLGKLISLGKLQNVYRPLNTLREVSNNYEAIEEIKSQLRTALQKLTDYKTLYNGIFIQTSTLFETLYGGQGKDLEFDAEGTQCNVNIRYVNIQNNPRLVCTLSTYQISSYEQLTACLNNDYCFTEHNNVIYITPQLIETFTYTDKDEHGAEGSVIISIKYTLEEQDLILNFLTELEELNTLINNIEAKTQLIDTLKNELTELKLTGIVKKGKFVPFTTKLLKFDLLHPVNIEVLPSYDGSVNLILNDGNNIPRLINSGFSVTELGNWEIPNKLQEDWGYAKDSDLFDIDTSLIKRINNFPKIIYDGVLNSGNLKVGNYTIYFKYCDADGNETDFIGESGIISIFKGIDGDPFSIDGGVEDMNANKSIKIRLEDVDYAYSYINIYYVRSSSAIDSDRIPLAYKISKRFPIKNQKDLSWCDIIITGNENVELIPLSEINTLYYVANTSKTLAQCLNILFLGNNTLQNPQHKNLLALSLYIVPYGIKTKASNKIGKVNPENYKESNSNFIPDEDAHIYPMEYYNTKNIYYNVGYWNEEYYRLGIVYIFNDNTKSPVYNIIGGELFKENIPEPLTVLEDGSCSINQRNIFSDGTNTIERDYVVVNNTTTKDNVLGVVYFNDFNPDTNYLYSIGIQLPTNFSTYLKKYNIKGFFFVRQKRIPTIAALGYTLPWDKEAKVPILTYFGNRIGTSDDIAEADSDKNSMLGKKRRYCIESFLELIGDEVKADNSEKNELMRKVTHTYYKRLHHIPDWAIDKPMFIEANTLSNNPEEIVSQIWNSLNWVSNGGFYYSETNDGDIAQLIIDSFKPLYINERKSGLSVDAAKENLLKWNYSYLEAQRQYNLHNLSGYIYKFDNITVTDTHPSITDETNITEGINIYIGNTPTLVTISDSITYSMGGITFLDEEEIRNKLVEEVLEVLDTGVGTVNYEITCNRFGVPYTASFFFSRTIKDTQALENPFANMEDTVKIQELRKFFKGYYLPSINYKVNQVDTIYLKSADYYSFATKDSAQHLMYYFLNGHLANKEFEITNGTELKTWLVKHYYDLYKNCNGKLLTAICPEFEVRQHYFNTLFTGTEFNIKYLNKEILPGYLGYSKERYYYVKYPDILPNPNTDFLKFKIVSVTDTVPVVAIDKTIYKSVIGSEAEAYRFAYINEEHSPLRQNRVTKDTYLWTDAKRYNDSDHEDFNFVRGIYSPYLGIDAVDNKLFDADEKIYNQCLLFNIYYDNVKNSKLENEKIRFEDNSSYSAISDIFTDEFTSINLFRGDCFLCTFTHRLNRNFNDPTAPTNDHIIDELTWHKNYYDKGDSESTNIENLNRINRGDINAVKLGSWITIKFRSSYNLSIRSLDESHLQESGIMGKPRGFYPLQQASPDGGYKIPNSYVINDGFGSTTGEQYYNTLNDAPYLKNEFDNLIAYSNVSVNDAFINGYRVFKGQHYRDYTKQYGSITKLVELQGNLLCVFEHGTALIPVNERALAAEGSGGEVYINNSNVLPETPKILSDMFGSQWIESIVKTPYYVYGVDAARKKIWRTNGALFEVISDFRVEKFLVDNLTIDNNDNLPVLGIKNIVTHYNANKSDVMFTFYTRKLNWNVVTDLCGNIISQDPILNDSIVEDELAWNICYNEILQKFETFYSWIPIASANIDNEFYSFDRECSREILLNLEEANNYNSLNRLDEYVESKDKQEYWKEKDPNNRPGTRSYHLPIKTPYLWKHGKIGTDRPKPTHWYGEQHPFEFEFIVNAEAGVQKIFDNLRIISNNAEPESFHFTIEGDNYEFSSDKPNMYYRQEATKELFLNLGSHISFKENYKKLFEHLKQHTKSTIFPLYYNRIDVFNDIYDHYTLMLDNTKSRDYKELSGSEINWDEDLQQFFITTHVKNNPIDKNGYLRGNSRYLEGLWQILIPTITLMLKNEENYWDEKKNWNNRVPPIVINPNIPDDLSSFIIDKNGLPNTYSMGDIRTTGWTFRKETNIRDKYCKIRIRYSGEKLAVISAVITTFTLSYA